MGYGNALATLPLEPDSLSLDRCGSHTPTWHVAQTHPQAERWARDNLANQGYVVYLPMDRVLRRDRVLRSMTRAIEVPLFTSYLFISLTPGELWAPICHTRGVARIFLNAGRPHSLPYGTVEAIQAGEARRLNPRSAASPWAPGDACRLATGAFAGHEAAVVDTDADRGTVRIAVMVFGALRHLVVGADALIERA